MSVPLVEVGADGTSLTVTVPKGRQPGPVPVRVETPNGPVGPPLEFTYHPAVTSLEPSTGSTGEDTALTILGEGLSEATLVQIDGENLAVTESSTSEVKTIVPAKDEPGEVDVVVLANELASMPATDGANIFTIAEGGATGNEPPPEGGQEGPVRDPVTGNSPPSPPTGAQAPSPQPTATPEPVVTPIPGSDGTPVAGATPAPLPAPAPSPGVVPGTAASPAPGQAPGSFVAPGSPPPAAPSPASGPGGQVVGNSGPIDGATPGAAAPGPPATPNPAWQGGDGMGDTPGGNRYAMVAREEGESGGAAATVLGAWSVALLGAGLSCCIWRDRRRAAVLRPAPSGVPTSAEGRCR